MKPVARNEVLGIADYEVIRERFRARVIEEKKARRVAVGPRMTAVFENHDTVLLQIQEMIRTERITRESSILHEIETYNALVPGANELSATFFIEISERAEREAFLREATGIEKHTAIFVAGQRFSANWDQDRVHEDRASAVLYLRFALSEGAVRAIVAESQRPDPGADGATVRPEANGASDAPVAVELVVDHPAYGARAALAAHVLRSLAEDFSG